jgi:hypothetical protein
MKKGKKKMGRPKGVIPMIKLTLSIPEEVRKKWYIQAANEDTTMSELAARLINDYIKKKGG